MTERMSFYVEGRIQGWQRSGQDGYRHFDTKKNAEYKKKIRTALHHEAMLLGISLPIEVPPTGFFVNITAYKHIPESWSKKKKQQALDGIIKPTSYPDADNIAKQVLDAMCSRSKNGKTVIKAFEDDRYVTDLSVSKRFTGRKEDILHIEISWR